MQIREHVPLAPYTTFHIGGPAQYFVNVASDHELREAVAFAKDRRLPIFILGGGSNVLIADEGFPGLVIKLQNAEISIVSEDYANHLVHIEVSAGTLWDVFVEYAIAGDLYGIENLSGIPGTVGGAVVANIGAYGAECADTLISAEVLCPDGQIKIFQKEECRFAYHESIFSDLPGYIVLRATFALHTSPTQGVRYKDHRFDVSKLLKEHEVPTLRAVREAILSVREQKGALIMEGRMGFRCAGSFFHMPHVSKEQYRYVLMQAKKIDPQKEAELRPWAWEKSDGAYKIAPGFLLEYTEFQKGYRRFGVGISPLHTLSVVNFGDASAEEVARLAHDMQHAVEKLFHIVLEQEVEYIGKIKL